MNRAKSQLILLRDPFTDLPDAVGDIANHFDLWKIDGIDRSRKEIHMDDFNPIVTHEERRLFNHVMADVDDQIRGVNHAMYEVVVGKRCVAHEQRVCFIDNSLSHLCRHERNAGLFDESPQ